MGQSHSEEFDTHVYVAILILVSCGTMYICRRRNLRNSVDYPNDSSDEKPPISGPISRLAFGGMAVFLCGSTFFDAVSMVATAECLYTYQINNIGVKITAVVLLTVIMKPVYMAIQIAFLSWSGNWLARHGELLNQNVFIVNGFINISLIIYNIFYESRELFGKEFEKECININKNSSSMYFIYTRNQSYVHACLTHRTDLYRIENELEPYLFCFHAEFYVLATSLNLIIWRKTGHVTTDDQGAQNSNHTRVCETEADSDTGHGASHLSYGLSDHDAAEGCIDDTGSDASSGVGNGWFHSLVDSVNRCFRTRRVKSSTSEEESSSLLPRNENETSASWCLSRCGILGICLAFVYVLLQILMTRSHRVMPLYFFTPFVFACLLIVTIHIYLRLKNILNQGAPVQRSIPVGLVVLIMSGFGCNLFNMICCVSSIVLMFSVTL
jgi:hypothetical protein